MKPYIIIIYLLLSFSCMFSQSSLITIDRNGTDIFYASIDSLINNTEPGDIIKFPGGSFIVPNNEWIIDKELHILGVGYRADSSIATTPTTIIGDIRVSAGGDNGSISGIYISGYLTIAAFSGGSISNYTVSRCLINNKIFLNSTASNNFFYENVVIGNPQANSGSISPSWSAGNTFSNNIILRSVSGPVGAGTIFSHNIFLSSGNPFSSANTYFNISLDHNIFLTSSTRPGNGMNNSSFVENLFVSDWTGNFGNNSNVNNIFNQLQSSIFVNQTGFQFDLGHDYHIQTSSPGYQGGGVNQVGIFGGNRPFKLSGHPATPRIIQAIIDASTDGSGNLPVKFIIEAQNN